jgi:predicted transcriptional regulator
VTKNSTPAGDELTERARFLAAVEEGLADADAGRGVPHAQVVREMRARFATKRRAR